MTSKINNKNNNISKRKSSLTKNKKQQQQQQQQLELERKQLYEAQQNVMIRKFPTRLSDREEIDRLKVCVAQTLAVMDRFLEFWQVGVCPFALPHPEPTNTNKPKPEAQPTPTTTQPITTTKPDNGPNRSPYL